MISLGEYYYLKINDNRTGKIMCVRLLAVTKKEIDNYFSTNYGRVKALINEHRHRCVTANVVDITTDIYLLCVDRANKLTIEKIEAFIGTVAKNIYSYPNSQLNYKQNKIVANDYDFSYIYEEEDETSLEVEIQNMEYLFHKYLSEAKLSEKLFFNLYVNEGVRSVRKVRDRLNISHHGAWVLINDFKHKIQEYERKSKIEG